MSIIATDSFDPIHTYFPLDASGEERQKYEEFICCICFQYTMEPEALNCRHVCCKKCLDKYMTIRKQSKPLEPVTCPHGCNVVIPEQRLPNHSVIAMIQNIPYQCTKCDEGIAWGPSGKTMIAHDLKCNPKIVTCTSCLLEYKENIKQPHVCYVTCVWCKKSILGSEMKYHCISKDWICNDMLICRNGCYELYKDENVAHMKALDWKRYHPVVSEHDRLYFLIRSLVRLAYELSCFLNPIQKELYSIVRSLPVLFSKLAKLNPNTKILMEPFLPVYAAVWVGQILLDTIYKVRDNQLITDLELETFIRDKLKLYRATALANENEELQQYRKLNESLLSKFIDSAHLPIHERYFPSIFKHEDISHYDTCQLATLKCHSCPDNCNVIKRNELERHNVLFAEAHVKFLSNQLEIARREQLPVVIRHSFRSEVAFPYREDIPPVKTDVKDHPSFKCPYRIVCRVDESTITFKLFASSKTIKCHLFYKNRNNNMQAKVKNTSNANVWKKNKDRRAGAEDRYEREFSVLKETLVGVNVIESGMEVKAIDISLRVATEYGPGRAMFQDLTEIESW